MDRAARAAIAAETDRLVASGRYGPVPESVLYLPGDGLPRPVRGGTGTVEVTAETSLAATARLAAAGPDQVACLNFASAGKPGGGYASGAQAQEESLARASALAASLRTVPAFYDFHRRQADPLYSDRVIYSPDVPVFRDDAGRLVEPYPVAFLTCAAPNAAALRGRPGRPAPGGSVDLAAPRGSADLAAARGPVDLPAVLERRAARVLGVAARYRHRRLVLGAWGCGVFGNDPRHVADAFGRLLGPGGGYAGTFALVVFAVPDEANRRPFAGRFGGPAPRRGPTGAGRSPDAADGRCR